MATANDYRSWSFADRPFLFAVLVSLLWHIFWFFSVTIVVAPHKRAPKAPPVIVSLGPVLNDSIFKTLVESRPEISKAFYRQPADFSSATEAPMETVPRYDPGDVVSVPEGKKFMGALKDRVGGDKASPDAGLPTLVSDDTGDYFELSGAPETLQILSRPPVPSDLLLSAQPTEIEFSIDAHGRMSDSEVVVSGGDPASDLAWEDHLRQWIFAEESVIGSPASERLRVKFHASLKRTA